ncbi:ParB N-terminal domain-containing protein [Bosea sp. (in: a-proteobacteria)]|uniref:ParB N-terminal domain-containing protein n=1 Tax=Bosea sp. (in: a-proteobacteria) TaxID=1871050 RepID=UPI0025C0AE4D|nr:ParB N-terminal domain-containing protein [Bosea sp. (in: a-proteobacteria)]
MHQIVQSIKVFGFTNPVAVNSLNEIIAGHGRCEAAKMLGMKEVPAIRLDHLTSEQARR